VLERQLYLQKSLYVGIRRNWTLGPKILFVKKTADGDVFLGSGTIHRVVDLDELDEYDRRSCIENNWFAKILFAKLIRYHPSVRVQDTFAANLNPLILHGADIVAEELSRIESISPARIIT